MKEGMENLAAEIEARQHQSAVSGKATRCPVCERKGLPILPVRYAVCKRIESNADVPELPAGRIGEFTNVTLDKALVNGVKVDKTLNRSVRFQVDQAQDGKVCKYVLRQMRPGYFYVFDQNSTSDRWYAYLVTTDGMFYQYPATERPPGPENAKFDCLHKPEEEKRSKALSGSIVNLPTADKGSVFYYAYTEHLWTPEHLEMIENSPEWREKNMQRFAISGEGSVSGQDHVYPIDQLNYVLEYNSGSVERPDLRRESGGKRRLFSQQDMIRNIEDQLHTHADWVKGKELILAVKDEADIIDELNFYRMAPLSDLQHYLRENNKENQRKLVISQSLDAFKDNFRSAQESTIKEKYDIPASTYEETRRWDIEQMRRAAEHTHDEAARAVLEARIARLEAEDEAARQRREKAKEGELAGVDATVKDWESQVRDLYDDSELLSYYDRNVGLLEDFKREYNQRSDDCESLVAEFDADYALWIKEHLTSVIDRYSETDFISGLSASSLIASLLTGGILSPSSFSVWEEFYRKLNSEDSIIVRGLFCNQAALVREVVSDVTGVAEGKYLGGGKLDSWKRRFNELFIPYEKNAYEPNYLVQLTLPSLIGNVANSIAAVALQDKNADRETLAVLVRYAQILYCMQEDVRGSSAEGSHSENSGRNAPSLQMMNVDMSSEAVCQWLVHMSHQNQLSSRSIHIDDVMEFPEGDGGNIAVASPSDSGGVNVSISIPVVNVDEARIDEVDQEDLKKWREDNALSAVSVGKAAIGLATAKDVSRNTLADPVGKVLISTVSILESVKVLYDESLGKAGKEGEKPDWAKIAAASATLVKSVAELRGAAIEVRAAFMAWDATGRLPPVGSTSVLGVRLEKVALIKVIGAVADAISFYEGMNTIAQTGHNRDQGQSIEATMKGYLSGGMKTIASVFGLASVIGGGVPFVIVGLFFALGLLLLGRYFVNLVPQAVWMWVNRSLIGNHVGYIAPFNGAEEEMASLGLVFKGVTVDISKRDIRISETPNGERIVESATWSDHPDVVVLNPPNGKMLKVKIVLPLFDFFRLETSTEIVDRYEKKILSSHAFEKRSGEEVIEYAIPKSRRREEVELEIEEISDGFWSINYRDSYMSRELNGDVYLKVVLTIYGESAARVRSNFRIIGL